MAKDSRRAAKHKSPAERLLVVEDDQYLREEVMRVLARRTPYRADAAGSGEEALPMAERRRYDLLITDVRMPGIDGIELLARLKEQQPSLACIVITAFADEEATIRALRLGANDYIRKPFSIRDLISAIDRQVAVLRLQREAERSRRFLEELVRSVHAGVVAIDDGNRVASINTAALEILQADGDVIGRKAAGLFRFEGGETVTRLLGELDSKSAHVLERELTVRQAGLPITYRVSATVIRDREGNRLGTVLLFNDVSQLIQSQKLQAWKDLARTVAHEIKNPLTPIKLSAQQLLSAKEAGPEALESQLEIAVRSIIDNADRLDTLAREFSRFGRLPKPKLEPLQVEEVLQEALSAYRCAAEDKGVEIVSRFSGGLPQIKGDREALLRMAGNLISNAVDAMPGGGTLTVATSISENGMLRLSFADTGAGIAEEVKDRLFLPYVTSKPGGTGLGLVVVKEVVSLHDGEIDIESEPQKGTTITIEIPALKTE